MNINKRIISIVMAVVICLSFAIPCFAAADYRGDIDYDGYLTISDALNLFKHVAGLTDMSKIDAQDLTAADIDGDGNVDIRDTLWLFKYVAGIAELPEYKVA